MGQYYYVPDPGEQRTTYSQPVPDRLMQLRQNQMMQNQPQMTQPMQAQPQQQDNGGIIWVQGEAGAKAYLVAPGNTVQLWDSENQVIYLKSADMSGMPSMRILDYTERTAVPKAPHTVPGNPPVDYVTREEYAALAARVDALAAEKQAKPAKKTVKEEADNG